MYRLTFSVVLSAPRNFRKRIKRTAENEVWFGLQNISVQRQCAYAPFSFCGGKFKCEKFFKG